MDPLPMSVHNGKRNCSLEALAGHIKTLLGQILDYPWTGIHTGQSKITPEQDRL